MACEGFFRLNHGKRASFCGWYVIPFILMGNGEFGRFSTTSPVSSKSWQLPLGELHHGVIPCTPSAPTKGSLILSVISWLIGVISSKFSPKKLNGVTHVEKFRTYRCL